MYQTGKSGEIGAAGFDGPPGLRGLIGDQVPVRRILIKHYERVNTKVMFRF